MAARGTSGGMGGIAIRWILSTMARLTGWPGGLSWSILHRLILSLHLRRALVPILEHQIQ